ncbi:MAG TPA: phosphate ABC transporter substrate-binding protein PstS [Candidatus Binataceae bacterium]|nr:phosphate ABC transporter substrate-binding protein PstS [Candidatus Binataceae bacterium]
MIRKVLSGALVFAALVIAASNAHAQTLINGAGSTFGYPIYSKWFDEYVKVDPSMRFNYQSIGSGGGINLLFNKTVDIGASDAPLSDEQIKRAPGPILEFPSVLGAVVMTYNVQGLTKPLRLTGPLIANIYLGKVGKWNDPAIAALNPGVTLPDQQIVTCHRSEGSGTTYIFADYMSKVSPEWAAKVGKSTSLRWPGGLGGKGSEGVTALVEQTPGALGYVELTYALANKLAFATIQNKDGKWIAPSLDGVTAAAAGASTSMPSDFRVSITDAPGATSYPLSSFTWLLVYQQQADATRGAAIVKFLHWGLTKGQKSAPPLYYAPLPKAVVALEMKQLKEIVVP